MKLVGILGGTFDPVHLGHLRAAVELREFLDLDHVRLIPCGHPPHRASPAAAAEQRLHLLRKAVGDEPGLVVDDIEIHAPGPSYTVGTLAQLRGKSADTGFCMAMGLDAFRYLHTWHRWRQLFELAHIVVMHRPGWQATQVLQDLDAAVRQEVSPRLSEETAGMQTTMAGSVCFLPVTGLDISSTRIRELVRTGRSIRYLVPELIVEDVRTLYSNRD